MNPLDSLESEYRQQLRESRRELAELRIQHATDLVKADDETVSAIAILLFPILLIGILPWFV